MDDLTPEEEQKMHNFYRTSGDMICKKCGKNYYSHPMYEPSAKTCGHAWLRILCNGDLVKL